MIRGSPVTAYEPPEAMILPYAIAIAWPTYPSVMSSRCSMMMEVNPNSSSDLIRVDELGGHPTWKEVQRAVSAARSNSDNSSCVLHADMEADGHQLQSVCTRLFHKTARPISVVRNTLLLDV